MVIRVFAFHNAAPTFTLPGAPHDLRTLTHYIVAMRIHSELTQESKPFRTKCRALLEVDLWSIVVLIPG